MSAAQATAKELVSKATVDTSSILALEQESTPQTRGSMILREYRSGMAEIVGRRRK